MMTIARTSLIALALPMLVLTGCPNSTTGEHPDPEPDAGSTTKPTVDAQPAMSNIPKSPLGTACSSNADCTSGFCTDGVCCDSACVETCYTCNQPAAPGHCAALASGEDRNASTVCTAPSACSLSSSSNAPSCKIGDGTACQADGDCISGHCLTYYADADGDGYGGSDEAHFCAELDSAPLAGYASYTGDCCDLDAGANPGFDSSQFLTMPDACGSYDWNCNGVVAQLKVCVLAGVVTPLQCGQVCELDLSIYGMFSLFTEACN